MFKNSIKILTPLINRNFSHTNKAILGTKLYINNNNSNYNRNNLIDISIINNKYKINCNYNNNNNNNILNKRYSTTNSNNNTTPTTTTTTTTTTSNTTTTTTTTTTNTEMSNENNKTILDKYLKNIYEYPKFSSKWWLEKSYIFAIFGVTGTSSLYVVKFLLKNIFNYANPQSLVSLLSGSAPIDGKYLATYFLTMYTVYPFILLFFGTLFGRYQFFVKFFNRMNVFSQIQKVFSRIVGKNKSSNDNKKK